MTDTAHLTAFTEYGDDLAAVRARSKRYTELAGTDLEASKLLRHAAASADDVPDLLAEIDAFRGGVGQLAMDPPSLESPRVASVREGIPVFFLQQTHNGVPAWICADCIRFVLGADRPDRCIGCGGCGGDGEGHLTEMLYPKVLIDQDNPNEILSE